MKDFDAANAQFGFDETPEGYVWHHVDNYDVSNNTLSLELVRKDAHKAAFPHFGSCGQYDSIYGPTYNK